MYSQFMMHGQKHIKLGKFAFRWKPINLLHLPTKQVFGLYTIDGRSGSSFSVHLGGSDVNVVDSLLSEALLLGS